MMQKEYLSLLSHEVKTALELSNEGRVEFIKSPKFIKHPKALKLFEKLVALMNYSGSDQVISMFLIGDSNNGKTAMVKKFYEMNVYRDDEKMLFFEHVMLIQAPNRADLHDLYNKMFQFFVVPYIKNAPISEREKKIKHYCEVNEVKMIIIDEIQGVLTGSITKQVEFMNGIKNLSNILKIPIVLVGTPHSTSLVRSDHQLKKRFAPVKVKKWEYNKDYLSLLHSIEMTLPLKKPSNIYEDEKLAKEILELSDGLIGDIMTICELLAIKAVESKKEKIERKMIKEIEYVPAYDREGIIYADEI